MDSTKVQLIPVTVTMFKTETLLVLRLYIYLDGFIIAIKTVKEVQELKQLDYYNSRSRSG